MAGARALYANPLNNNGASVIDDRRSTAVLPLNDEPWAIHPDDANADVLVKGLAQFVGNTYKPFMAGDDYEYVFFDGDAVNTPQFYDTTQTYINNLQGKAHIYQRLYSGLLDNKLLMYKPITDDITAPVIVAFKGTDSMMDTIVDFHLFSSWVAGGEPTGFQSELQERINAIKNNIFEVSGFGNYPVIFVSHSLGCAYASKAYEYFCNDDDYKLRMSQLYMFNPYILGGTNHESISQKCRDDPVFRHSIQTYMSDSDPFSLQFKHNGFGVIHLFPSRTDPTEAGYYPTISDFLTAVNDGSLWLNIDHRYVNWTAHETTPIATIVLPPTFISSEHTTRIQSIRTHNTDFNVEMVDGTQATHQMALQLDESNHFGTAHYPERNEDVAYYTCNIKPVRLGHTADLRAKYKNVVSTLYQPANNADERMLYFSPVYFVHTQVGAVNYYNYCFFYRRETSIYDKVYVAHLDYTKDIGASNYIKFIKVKSLAGNADQSVLALMDKDGSDSNHYDMDSIYVGKGISGASESQAVADNARDLTTWVIDDGWNQVSHPDNDEMRRTIGGTIGQQTQTQTPSELVHQLFQNVIPSASDTWTFQIYSHKYTDRYITYKDMSTYHHLLSVHSGNAITSTYPIVNWTFTWDATNKCFEISSGGIQLGRLLESSTTGLVLDTYTAGGNYQDDNTYLYNDGFYIESAVTGSNNSVFRIMNKQTTSTGAYTALKVINTYEESGHPQDAFGYVDGIANGAIPTGLSTHEEFYFELKTNLGNSIDWTQSSSI